MRVEGGFHLRPLALLLLLLWGPARTWASPGIDSFTVEQSAANSIALMPGYCKLMEVPRLMVRDRLKLWRASIGHQFD